MLYLSNELFKQRGKHIRLIVGDPIKPSFLMKNKDDNKLAALIKEKVYQLHNEL